ncbi:HMG-box, partial [Schizopora paradoxa]
MSSLANSNSSSSRPRRRRRDSSGNEHIPRPPNAFMLYRQNFVHQRHVPGSIETNHNSLSRIVGDCWKQLPASEKKVWEEMAERKKAEHKKRYPDYRFQPKH